MKYYDFFYWENYFTQEQILNLNKIARVYQDNTFIDHPATTDNNKKLKNLDKVSAVKWIHVKESLDKLYESVILTNREQYGFYIDPLLNSDNVLFNTYVPGSFYDWHKDASNNPFHDVKFTILINNSTRDYTGGDFQIFSIGGEKTVHQFNKSGSVVMFKSDSPHRVLPIKTGERSTIAFFIKGSKFV